MVDRLLTIAGAAEALGCHPETIRRAIKAEKLACYRLLGCIRIGPDQLAAFLETSLCPAQDKINQGLSGGAGLGTSSDGTATADDEFRRARRIRKSLDNPSRTTKPNLRVIR